MFGSWWVAKKEEITMIELRYCEECACYVTDTCRSGHKTLEAKVVSGSSGYQIVRPKETPKPPNDNPSHYSHYNG